MGGPAGCSPAKLLSLWSTLTAYLAEGLPHGREWALPSQARGWAAAPPRPAPLTGSQPGPSLKTYTRVVRQPSALSGGDGAGGWVGTGVPDSSTSRCVNQTRTGPPLPSESGLPRAAWVAREYVVSAAVRTQGLTHSSLEEVMYRMSQVGGCMMTQCSLWPPAILS